MALSVKAQTTISYNLKDGSTFTNAGSQWSQVTSTTSPDGKLRTQAATSLWHSSGYGVVFKEGNSLEIDVSGTSKIRFYGSIYSQGTMSGGTTIGGNELGTLDVKVTQDITGFYEFSYVGSSKTLYFTFSGANAYTPSIDIVYPYTVYNLKDGSTFTNTGSQWDPVTSTTSPDGKLRTQSATSLWHSSGYGVVFKNGNSLEIDVEGSNTIVRFYGSIYSQGTLSGGTTAGGSDLGAFDVKVTEDKTGFYEFNYVGGPTTLYFTFSGANAYTPAIQVTNLTSTNTKTDVWDFGAAQLDEVLYNNMLNVDKINAWYSGINPGTSGVNLPSTFTEGILTWVSTSSTSDRLRTTNENLTRFDTNLGTTDNSVTGRLYVNTQSSLRFINLTLDEDDEITLLMNSQNGLGNVHFEYASDQSIQDDEITIGSSLQEVKFVAKVSGEYKIHMPNDKPSYYRIYRREAKYVTITGNVDTANAPDLPNNYTIDFTNEAGKTFSAVVSSGVYTIDLPADYTYTASVGGANGYLLGNESVLEVIQDSETYDVQIIKVTLFAVTGNISGLTDLTNLKLSYTPDATANKVYTPSVIIDKVNATYSVNLEADVEYSISAEGVNDFEISSNKITITANQTEDIIFSLKPIYTIAITAPVLNQIQLDKLSLTFTNLNEEGYSYTFSDLSTISLRDGVYVINYQGGLDEYPLEMALSSNLTVSGADTSKELKFKPITEWVFTDRTISNATAYKGLSFTGSVNVRGGNGDLNAASGATITIPVKVGEKVVITDYYTSNYTVEGGELIQNTSNSTSVNVVSEYIYQGTSDGTVTINIGGITYFKSIKKLPVVEYRETITVGSDKDYQTITDAIKEIENMVRSSNELVTVLIDPGNYEEMLVINNPNITLKNAASTPSIGLLNKGVDIENGAVRITSYYGQKYNFFSQGNDNKWSAEALEINKANGYTNYVNKEGTGSGSSYWNATVVVNSVGFTVEDIILENSFNQYISKKESEDIVLAKDPNSQPIRPTDYGNTAVQNRGAGYVTQAAAIGISSSADKIILKNCRVIGRQDSFYGAAPARVVVYKGIMMGAVDYIFGGMNAVFYKTDFVFNTSDTSSDAAYITAAQQQNNQRGYLMYECHIKSPIEGVETASSFGAKPGYFGRPWSANFSEVVFFKTTIDKSTYPGSEGLSLIDPVGWTNSLGGESPFMYEFGTVEEAEVNNLEQRASWSTVLTSPTLTDGIEITTFNFTKGNDSWDPITELNSNSLGSSNFENSMTTKLYGSKGRIVINNVTKKSAIKIYTILGVLVKDLSVEHNSEFSIKSGLYFATVKTSDGEKSVKLLVE